MPTTVQPGGGDPGGGALADLVMDGGIAHHPAFADVLAAGLELRLHERHELGLFGGERRAVPAITSRGR